MNFNKSFEISPEMKNILPDRNKKKPTRNFLMENKRHVREMQHQMEANRKIKEEAKLQSYKRRSPFTATKSCNPTAWVKFNPSDENISAKTGEKSISETCTNYETSLRGSLTKQFINQGVQTSPPRVENEINETSKSSVITPLKEISKTTVDHSNYDLGANIKENAINKLLKESGVNFVELNKRGEYRRKVVQEKPNPTGIPPNYHLGVLPRYLKIRKQANEQSEDSEHRSDEPVSTSAQLPGHILLTDEERIEHLKKMKKCYEELLIQFNQLPIRSDSLKAKQKRADLEKQLDGLEKSMKLFSREKLYIKL